MLIIQSIIDKLSTLMALHVFALQCTKASNNTIVCSIYTTDYFKFSELPKYTYSRFVTSITLFSRM